FEPGSGNNNTLISFNGFGLGTTTGIYFKSGTYYQTGFIQSLSTRVVTAYGPTGYVERSGSVQIYTEYGNATYKQNGSNNGLFTLVDTPYISGFTATAAATGTYIRITGSGMRDVTGVYFGAYSSPFTLGAHLASDIYVASGLVPYVTDVLPKQAFIKVYNHGGNDTSDNLFTILEGGKNFYGDIVVSGGGIYVSGNSISTGNGIIVQYISTMTSGKGSATTIIPSDNTIPLNTEGDAFTDLDTSITPKSLTNRLEAELNLLASVFTPNYTVVASLFRDWETNAIAATANTSANAEGVFSMYLKWTGAPTGLTPHLFNIRFGPAAAATAFINRTNTFDNYLGTAGVSTMTIKEVTP
ncbi:MAG: hypothetical protein Q8L52_02380, partial [bacterium]|nr:hypothetical protein [bacterium]